MIYGYARVSTDHQSLAAQAQTPSPPSPAETRRMIEEAAQAALDTADGLLAILDHMDGDAHHEDGGEAELSLSASENRHGSEVVRLRNNDSGQEADAPEVMFPVVVAADRAVIPFTALPWGGSGNVVAAAGVALLNMVGGR